MADTYEESKKQRDLLAKVDRARRIARGMSVGTAAASRILGHAKIYEYKGSPDKLSPFVIAYLAEEGSPPRPDQDLVFKSEHVRERTEEQLALLILWWVQDGLERGRFPEAVAPGK